MSGKTERETRRPLVVGVAGEACVGKTSFTAGLAQVLGAERVTLVCSDAYRRLTRSERHEAQLSRLHSDLYFLDILEQHLSLLKQGEPVLSPVYNRAMGSFDRPSYLLPREVILVEGLLAFGTASLQGLYDVKIYLDPEESLRQRWKLERDVKARKRREADVRDEMKRWEADAAAFVRPGRDWADMVVRFREPGARGGEGALSVILRPSLPRPDLTSLWQGSASGPALRLGLDRDLGLPVDRIDLDPSVADAEYLRCEKALWDSIRGAQHGSRGPLPQQAPAGGIMLAADGSTRQLRGLALAQLLAASHVVAAFPLSG